VHHSAIDGMSGNDLMAALLDESPEPDRPDEQPTWRPEAEPKALTLLTRSALSATRHPVRAVRISAAMLRSLPALATSAGRPR
jgi:diacylglycerol O-acyltransferase / wax synthase